MNSVSARNQWSACALILLVLAVSVFTVSRPATADSGADNLLANPSFEAGAAAPDDWDIQGAGTYPDFQNTLDSSVAHSGIRSVKTRFDQISSCTFNVSPRIRTITPIDLVPGYYNLSFWAKGTVANVSSVSLQLSTAGGSWEDGQRPLVQNQWTEYTFRINLMNRAAPISLTLSIGNEGSPSCTTSAPFSNVVWFDDVRLVRATPPPATRLVWVGAPVGIIAPPPGSTIALPWSATANRPLFAGPGYPLAVRIIDANNDQVLGDNSTVVTIVKVSGPGTLTCTPARAVAGFAILNRCIVSMAGTYVLRATVTSGLIPADTPPFSVAPALATALAFVARPSDTTIGLPITPLAVEVRDAGGNVVMDDNSTRITLTNTSGPGALSCPSAVASAGVATFVDCSIDGPGRYALHATSIPALTPADSATFDCRLAAFTWPPFVPPTLPSPLPQPSPAPVSPGHNLVTWNGMSGDVGELLAAFSRPVRAVYEFDVTNQTWLRYFADLPSYLNTLRTLSNGRTYWVIAD